MTGMFIAAGKAAGFALIGFVALATIVAFFYATTPLIIALSGFDLIFWHAAFSLIAPLIERNDQPDSQADPSADLEHPGERDLRPLDRLVVDHDLVHDVA